MERILSSFFWKARTRKLPWRRFVLFNIRAIRLRDDIIDRATDLKRERQFHPRNRWNESIEYILYLDIIRKKFFKKSPQLHTRSILFLLDDIKKKNVAECLFLILSETSIENIFIHSHETGNWSRSHERNKFVVIIREGAREEWNRFQEKRSIEGSFSWRWSSFIYGTLYSS